LTKPVLTGLASVSAKPDSPIRVEKEKRREWFLIFEA
jgi:hypothetical protein